MLSTQGLVVMMSVEKGSDEWLRFEVLLLELLKGHGYKFSYSLL